MPEILDRRMESGACETFGAQSGDELVEARLRGIRRERSVKRRAQLVARRSDGDGEEQRAGMRPGRLRGDHRDVIRPVGLIESDVGGGGNRIYSWWWKS